MNHDKSIKMRFLALLGLCQALLMQPMLSGFDETTLENMRNQPLLAHAGCGWTGADIAGRETRRQKQTDRTDPSMKTESQAPSPQNQPKKTQAQGHDHGTSEWSRSIADIETPVVIPVNPTGDRQAEQRQLREGQLLKEQKPPMGSKGPNADLP